VQRDGTTTRPERAGLPAGKAPAGTAYALRPAPGLPSRLRGFGLLLLIGHLTLVGWLILRPPAVGWTYPANLTPFASVDQALAVGGPAGVRQLASGLLPLAPLGVLLPLVGGRLRVAWLPSFLQTIGGAALLATALEILKSWAPGHVLNVDNILLGTLGVAFCHLAVVPAARAALGRHQVSRAVGAGTRSYRPDVPARALGGLGSPGTSTNRRPSAGVVR
jgi:hypothetical protein